MLKLASVKPAPAERMDGGVVCAAVGRVVGVVVGAAVGEALAELVAATAGGAAGVLVDRLVVVGEPEEVAVGESEGVGVAVTVTVTGGGVNALTVCVGCPGDGAWTPLLGREPEVVGCVDVRVGGDETDEVAGGVVVGSLPGFADLDVFRSRGAAVSWVA